MVSHRPKVSISMSEFIQQNKLCLHSASDSMISGRNVFWQLSRRGQEIFSKLSKHCGWIHLMLENIKVGSHISIGFVRLMGLVGDQWAGNIAV